MNDDVFLDYYYNELIMSLITMSMSAENQKEIVGIGCIGDEMLEDFDSFYNLRRQIYIDNSVFDERQLQLLDNFNKYLDKFCGQDTDFYWSFDELKNNSLWDELRYKAKEIISDVFGKNYTIELIREHKFIDGKMIEYSKRKLIESME